MKENDCNQHTLEEISQTGAGLIEVFYRPQQVRRHRSSVIHKAFPKSNNHVYDAIVLLILSVSFRIGLDAMRRMVGCLSAYG